MGVDSTPTGYPAGSPPASTTNSPAGRTRRSRFASEETAESDEATASEAAEEAASEEGTE
jgi:hypothetical protein